MKIAAVVCLVAVLATAGVQAMHVHARSTALDAHCSLCMVSHCVLRPQGSFAIPLPVRLALHYQPTSVSASPHSGVFHWFVRPPPSA